MAKRILAFVRFFKEEAHRDMFVRGELYMNRLKTFKQYEEEAENNVGDKHEAVMHWLQPGDVTVSIGDPNTGEMIVLEGIAAPVSVQNLVFDDYHVYCLFAVYFEEDDLFETLEDFAQKILPDGRLGDLGDYCSITDAVAFIDRLEKGFQSDTDACVDAGRGLVEYFDPDTFTGSFNGQEAIMRKKNCYAHQREYRFFTYNGSAGVDSRVLKIGDLSDITSTFHKSELSGIKLHIENRDGSPLAAH